MRALVSAEGRPAPVGISDALVEFLELQSGGILGIESQNGIRLGASGAKISLLLGTVGQFEARGGQSRPGFLFLGFDADPTNFPTQAQDFLKEPHRRRQIAFFLRFDRAGEIDFEDRGDFFPTERLLLEGALRTVDQQAGGVCLRVV